MPVVEAPAPATFKSYFARSRRWHDIAFLAASSTLLTFVCINRLLQRSCASQAETCSTCQALLQSFPCNSKPSYQALWTASHSIQLIFYLPWHCGFLGVSILAVTAWLQLWCIKFNSRWYEERGRDWLIAARRLLTIISVIIELRLGIDIYMTTAFVNEMMLGLKGVFSVVVWSCFVPAQQQSQLVVSALQSLLYITANAMVLGPAATPTYLLSLALQYAFVAVILPSAVLSYYERGIRARYLQQTTQPCPTHPSKTLHPATSSTPNTPPSILPATSASTTGAPSHLHPIHTDAHLHPKPVNPTHTTTTDATDPPTPCQIQSGPDACHSGRRRSLYRPTLQMKVISIKVFDHEAYNYADQLTAAVETCLSTLNNPQALPRHRIVATTAARGCLQLLVGVFELLPQEAVHNGRVGRKRMQAGEGECCEQLAALETAMLTTLKELGIEERVSVHCLDQGVVGRDGRPVVGVELEPGFAMAGLQKAQEVVVRAVGGAGGEVGEAVCSCWVGGREVVLKERWLGGGAGAAQELRLTLPADLDAAPVAVHLVATRPGREGSLLASTTTMALPPTAASELLLAFEDAPTDPQAMHAFRGLLRDMAAACTALRAPQLDCPPSPLAAELIQWLGEYFSTEAMHACSALLHQLQQPRNPPAAPALPLVTHSSTCDDTPSSCEACYKAWIWQQGRGTDAAMAVVFSLVIATVLQKAVATSPDQQTTSAVVFWCAMRVCITAAPYLLLASAGPWLRARRAWVMVAQMLCHTALYLAAARCWLVCPKALQQAVGKPPVALTVYGVFVPGAKRLPWKQILLLTLLLETLPMHYMLASPACPCDHSSPSPSATDGYVWRTECHVWRMVGVTFLAAATSYLVEAHSRAAFKKARLSLSALATAGSKDL